MAQEWRTTGQAVPALAKLDEMAKALMTRNGIPHGAIAVTRGARLIFARAYSWTEPGGETAQPTSLFRIASCTKPITGIAIQKLVEAGKLTHKDTVQSILKLTAPGGAPLPASVPPADQETPGHYFGAVQVGHLLRHQGGWDRGKVNEPTFFFDPTVAQAFGKELPVTRTEIARWGATQQMQFFPGARSAYSNFGYNLLGLVVERLTGTDYITHVRNTILGPLGIRRPRLGMPLERSRAAGEVAYFPSNPRLADDLTGNGGQVPIQYGGENNANFASFGGWIMAAPDYARLLAAYTTTARPTTVLPRDMPGWNRVSRAGVGCSEHGGGLPGSMTYIGLRDDDIGIVAFFNGDKSGSLAWNGSTQDFVEVSHQIVAAVPATAWPSHDLFPSVLTTPVPPGPEKLHLFVTDARKQIRDATWEQNVASGAWQGWWNVRQGGAQPGSPVTAVSRRSNQLDAFVVGEDGGIWTAAWQAGALAERWAGWWRVADGKAPLGSQVTAVSRHPDKLDVFVVGLDGGVYTAAWELGDASWRGWWRIGDLKAKPGTAVAAVARAADKLDVFVAGADGKVYTAAWEAGDASWRGWWSILGGAVPAGGAVSAVSRHPDKLDVFVASSDGGVYTAAWEAGDTNWRGWWRIGDLKAKPGAAVAAVARAASKLDVFVAGADGKVYTAAWEAGDASWRGWWSILGGAVPAGGAVSAVSRHPDKLDVFVVGSDGGVWSAAWQAGDTNWRGWWRIGDVTATPGSRVGVVSRRPA